MVRLKPRRKSLYIFVEGKFWNGGSHIWQVGSRVISVRRQWDIRNTEIQVINENAENKAKIKAPVKRLHLCHYICSDHTDTQQSLDNNRGRPDNK